MPERKKNKKRAEVSANRARSWGTGPRLLFHDAVVVFDCLLVLLLFQTEFHHLAAKVGRRRVAAPDLLQFFLYAR